MMKILLKATLLLAALTVYTSCSDDNDLKDPSERLQEATAKYMDVLTSAPNGWAMTMYGDLDFGGFNVLCKFEKNGKVTIANEKFAADTTAVSHFKLEQSSGVVLSFDEYCELFHYFSDPVNNDGYNSQTENGFGADLEFRIISASADSVVMRGKKHDTKIVMTPLTDDTTEITDSVWAKYLREVAAVAKVMQKGSYHMINGTDTLLMKANKRNRIFSYITVDSLGNRTKHTVPYIITPKGLSFYQPFTFGKETVKGFNYAADSEKYEQDGAKGIVLEKFTPDLNEQLIDGAWFISQDNLGTFAKRYWNRLRGNMLNKANSYIMYAVVGTWRNRFGLSIGPVDKDEYKGIYISEIYFDYEFIGSDQIRLWINGEYDEIGNAEYYDELLTGKSGKGPYLTDAFFPFAGMEKNSARTFKIETDDLKDPAYLKLVDQNQTSNIITLSSEQVLWPFGDKYE
ncbi:DUF4302 domain-containing protein [Prevotella communis]|uniref:DUF4302 domain-containing protein n=1 Tax=Prevotella communis TaxID=2913614 RepID=UPI001EDA2B71|nr:DUF4302 domain-containing protein [Prevotella communis]UKK59314.1 DUF4302 domain-containing protein [Prevotella communis]